MIDITTVPASVRQHLERSTQVDQQEEARKSMELAIVEIARTAPELAALIVASTFGKTQFEATLIEKHEYYERVKRTVLGFNCGDEFVPVTTTKTTTKRLVIR